MNGYGYPMTKHGLLICGLLLAAPVQAEPVDRSEQLYYQLTTVLASPYLLGSASLVFLTYAPEMLSKDDRRILADARDGALLALATGELEDVRLQAGIALLRKRFDLQDSTDLALAQWIAVNG